MPFLQITTNLALDADQEATVSTAASRAVAEALGKPERLVMVHVLARQRLILGATDEPAALLMLKSIALPTDQTAMLSRHLCDFLEAQLAIPSHRVFIEFTDVARRLWGWNGGTFEQSS